MLRTLPFLLVIAILVCAVGCITYSSVQRARGNHNVVTGAPGGKAGPVCYALLPLTIPLDIATSPVQLLVYTLLSASNTPL